MNAESFGSARVFALALVSTGAWLCIALLPYEVAALADDYHLGTAGAGWVSTAELLLAAITSSVIGQSVGKRDKRLLTITGLAIAVGATLGSLLFKNPVPVVGSRLAFGLGIGFVAAATDALPALHKSPGRLFAYMQLALGIVFALEVLAVGAIEPYAGVGSKFIADLLFLVILVPFALMLPKGIVLGMPPKPAAGRFKLPSGSVSALSALGLMWIAQGVLWAFARSAGTASGMDADSLVKWFSIAGFTTPFGAAAAALLGYRWGYVAPLVIGFLAQIFVALAEYYFLSRPLFIAGVLVANMTTTFTTPYLQAVLASLDRTGRTGAFSGAAVSFGAALGPAIGAFLIGQSVPDIGVASAVMFFAGLCLAVWSQRSVTPESRPAI